MDSVASQIVTAAGCGLGGLVVGCFLNAVVFRVPRQLSLAGPKSPSDCPACAGRLGAFGKVPVVSLAALRGHCRQCASPISVRYPIVELLTAAVFAGTAAALGTLQPLASIIVVCGCALAAAIIDAEGGRVPGAVALVGAIGALSLIPIAVSVAAVTRIGWAGLGAILACASAGVVDRAAGRDRWSRLGVLCAVGWSAGWLWPGGGPFIAAWVIVATAASGVGSGRRPPLAMLIAGSFAALLAAAVINRP